MDSKTNPIDGFISKYYSKISKRYIVIFIVSIITGIVAHGLALFNKYSFHDDTYSLFTVGATLSSGRYMLYEISHFIQTKIGGLFSTPLYEGLITIFLLSFSCMLIVNILCIQSQLLCGIISAYMVCFPVVTGMFGFMFTGCYYSFAIFLTALGAFFICKYKRWYTFLLGTFLIGNAIGIYQAYIPLFLAIYILCFFRETFVIGDDTKKNRKIILQIPYYLSAGIAPIIVYFFCNSIELKRYGQQLSNYKGIDKMGQMSFEQFIERTILAYKRFFLPKEDLFPKITYIIYVCIVFMCIFLSIFLIIKRLRKNYLALIISLLVISIIPLGFNFAYIMINEEGSVGTLQSYGYVMVIVWLILLLDEMEYSSLKQRLKICGLGITITVFMIFTYIRLDNIVYLKAEIMKERSLSYYIELITQIKSIKDYNDELPIVYIKNGNIDDSTIKELPVWDFFYVHPYCDINYNINYAWWGYIENWLGFSAQRIDSTEFEKMEEVKEMPCYPDWGSIKIINDVVVVKLADGDKN